MKKNSSCVFILKKNNITKTGEQRRNTDGTNKEGSVLLKSKTKRRGTEEFLNTRRNEFFGDKCNPPGLFFSFQHLKNIYTKNPTP